MAEPIYREALQQAWHLVWHNKVLWIFGLLAVLVGQFGLSNFLGQVLSLLNADGSWKVYLSSSWVEAVSGWSALWWAWLVVVIIAVVLLVALVGVVAQGALIAAGAEWYKKKKVPHFGKAWHRGAKHMWRLFFLNVLKKILLGAVVIAVAGMLGIFGGEGIGSLVGKIIVIALGLFLALMISAVGMFTAGYIVEEEDGLWSSLATGCRLWSEHLLVSLELTLMLVIVDIAIIALIALGSLIFFVPSFILTIVTGLTGNPGFLWAGFVISMTVFILAAAIFGAVYNAFTTSAWTYLFMKMHREGIISRLHHWLGGIIG